MAGGTFQTQNKVRPGAYINFKGVPKPVSKLGERGTVTMPVAMSWGPQIVELLSTDLLDGKSLNKIGYTAFDEESQIFREALKNAYKGIFYRIDTGATKGVATIGGLSITAKYAGALGSEVQVAVIANGARFDVVTFFKGVERHRQTVTTLDEVVNNDWAEFSGTGAVTESAGAPLTGAANGTISTSSYANYISTIKTYKWDTMGIPSLDGSILPNFEALIKDLRENKGRKVQIVVNDYDSNYEGIISTLNQGYKTEFETINPATFVAYIAGLTAGSTVSTSNTYHAIEGAKEIINPLDDDEIIAALKLGKLVLSTRQDGVIVVEQDINTLHDFTPDKGYTFSKNRVIRTLDELNNTVALLFEKSYIGKVDNDADGQNIFKSDIIQYMNTLQEVGAIKNFDSMTDVEVLDGQDIDSVVVNLAVHPKDSMEKLYMTVMVG